MVIVRTRSKNKIGVQGECRHPVCVVLEHNEQLPLYPYSERHPLDEQTVSRFTYRIRIPDPYGPVAAGSI